MKYQRDPWSCGAAAVVNAARVFGKKINEYTIRGLANTTKENGTQEWGILAALRSEEVGLTATEFSSNNKVESWAWLHWQLNKGKPVILSTQAWEHWVVAVGALGDYVVIIDSSNFKNNKKENGVHILTKEKLLYHWWNARKSVEGEERLYAIAVGRR